MRLYATITSERASKGQGGNKHLKTDFYIIDKENPCYRVLIHKLENGEIHFIVESCHFKKWLTVYNDIVFTECKTLKGKQQKGENYQENSFFYKTVNPDN